MLEECFVNDFVVVVVSFDGYSDIWDSFFNQFFENWPITNQKIYLINNQMNYTDERVKVINTGKEKTWSEKVRNGLSYVKEKNVILFLEDYLIANKIELVGLINSMSFFNAMQLEYLRLVNIPKIKGNEDFIQIKSNKIYGINLQLAIWNRDILIKNLMVSDYSAWEFEKKCNDKEIKINYYKAYTVKKNFINIKNGVIKGKWYPKTVKFFESKGIKIMEESKRGIMSFKETTRYELKSYISKVLPDRIQLIIKKILKFIGFKFVT